MARAQAILVTALLLCLIIVSLLHVTASKPIGFSLKLIPGDSPDSPLYPGNLTEHERIQRMVEFSKARANYLKSISVHNVSLNPDNIQLQVHKYILYYVVEVSLGIPKSTQMLLLDTGGRLTWTQCTPCINCFNQTYPIFNPSASNSYRKLSCHQLFDCVNDECVYDLRYLGGGTTKGVVSSETFQFPWKNRPIRPIPNVFFGCSNDNQHFGFSKTRRISGILGLATTPESLVGQLGRIINFRFSYCLAYAYLPLSANSPKVW